MRKWVESDRLAVVAVAVWLAAVAGGFAVWEAVEATPGAAGPPATAGPAVAVYVHPHCPCTRAVLPDLLAVAAAAPAGTEVTLVFVRPPGVPAGWERTRSWESASGQPGVTVVTDDGTRAAADGAETSGYVVARDAAGRVAYRGGLGRSGVGLRAVAAVLAGRPPEVGEAAVFGCPLVEAR